MSLESQFEKMARELIDKVRRGESLREAVVRSVQPLVKAAAIAAPRGSGALSRSMTNEWINAAPGQAIVRVGPGRPEGSHGILLEVGTIYMTARPFLASAYATVQEEIADRMGIEFLELLEE